MLVTVHMQHDTRLPDAYSGRSGITNAFDAYGIGDEVAVGGGGQVAELNGEDAAQDVEFAAHVLPPGAVGEVARWGLPLVDHQRGQFGKVILHRVGCVGDAVGVLFPGDGNSVLAGARPVKDQLADSPPLPAWMKCMSPSTPMPL